MRFPVGRAVFCPLYVLDAKNAAYKGGVLCIGRERRIPQTFSNSIFRPLSSFFNGAHLRNSPLSLLMIGDNHLKRLAYRFFWKQLVQLIKTASSLQPRAGPCGCFAVRALRSPDLIAHPLATFAARKLLALLVGEPDRFAPGASRDRRIPARHSITGGRLSPRTSLKVVFTSCSGCFQSQNAG